MSEMRTLLSTEPVRQPILGRSGRKINVPQSRLPMRPFTSAPFFPAILMICCAAEVSAQTGTVRGRAVRRDESFGVANAEILVATTGATTHTDAYGYFLIPNVTPGDAELRVRRPGFIPTALSVRVSAAATTEVEIVLTPAASRLYPVVTSAAAPARLSMEQIPGAVSVADSVAIQRGRTVGLHEALASIPGVQVASRYGTDDANIGIRGSAARARQAVRGISVLLDGVPLTEPDGVARLDMIELTAARQIEVVRGPASALFAGSPGGVINVLSRSGRDSPGVTARAQRGAFGFQKYDAAAGRVFADQAASAIGILSYMSSDGYRAHSNARMLKIHTAFDRVSKGGTRVALQATGSRLDSRLPGSLNQTELDEDARAAAPGAVASSFGRGDNRYRVGVQTDKTIGSGVANGYVFYGGRTLDFPVATQVVDLNVHRLQGGGRYRSGRIAALPIDVTVGMDYDRIFGTDQRWANNGGNRGLLRDDGGFGLPSIGGYAQLDWHRSTSWETVFGWRYDRVTYRFASTTLNAIPRQQIAFDQLSPRIETVWQPDLVTSVYGSAGRGFETPAVGEISASPGSPLRPVRPKSLWNYEIGGRRIFADRMRLEAAAFLSNVRNEFVPVTISGVSFPANASRSLHTGAEIGLTALASPRLDFSASYAFLDLRLKQFTTFALTSTGVQQQRDYAGKRLPAVPRHRLTGEVQLRFIDRLSLGFQGEWQGTVYVETGNQREGVWFFQGGPGQPIQRQPFSALRPRTLLNLNASGRLGAATLFVRIENLTGVRYTGNVVANESQGRFYEPGTARSTSVGFSLTGWGSPETRY